MQKKLAVLSHQASQYCQAQSHISVEEHSWIVLKIMSEFTQGFEKFNRLGPTVTIFGSARLAPEHPTYELTCSIAEYFSGQSFNVMSGGGPGVMSAANKGAQFGVGKSIGVNIVLPFEPEQNPYQDLSMSCDYFFSRKYFLIEYTCAFIVMPGGFGTLDEVFEVLTLMQTAKAKTVPFIFVNRAFWMPLIEWISSTLVNEKMIHADDLGLFQVVDTQEEVIAAFDTMQVQLMKKYPQANNT